MYAPEGGRATSLAYPYEKNGSTFHDITPPELRRGESSIAYSGVLRRMTDSSYLIRAAWHCALHDPALSRFHLQKGEREKEIDLCRKYGIVGRTKGIGRLEPRGISFSTSGQNDGGGGEPRN